MLPTRRSSLFPALCISALSAVPSAADAQSSLTMTWSSQVPAAVSEFKTGWLDAENVFNSSAAEHFKAASDRDPSFGIARVMSAVFSQSLSAADRTTEMNRGIADAAKAGTVELLLAMAWRASGEGRFAEARALFGAASQLLPDDQSLAFNAATLGVTVSSNAAEAARKLVARFPDYSGGYNTLAYSLWQVDDRAGALQAAKRQIELAPKNPNAYDSYGEMLAWSGNLTEAEKQYQQAVTVEPRFTEGYAGLAEVQALQGRGADARETLTKAAAAAWSPAERILRKREIAGTYILEGNYRAAINQLRAAETDAKASQIPGPLGNIYSHIGILESLLGNAAAAHASLAQSASATLPGGFGPLNRHLFAVYAHANLGHWDAAKTSLAAARSAASASTPNAPAAITLAEGYLALKEGRADAAMAAFSTADPGDVVAAAWLGQAHLAAGHGAMAAPLQKRFADNRQISFTDINWLTTKSPPRGGRAAQAKRPPRR